MVHAPQAHDNNGIGGYFRFYDDNITYKHILSIT